MKLLGIDYGRRRIGLAVTDDDGYCIRGLDVIDRKKTSDSIEKLLHIICAQKPQTIVFGLPLDVEDKETVMSREVREFASEVQKRSALPIEFIDESLSSRRATEFLSLKKKKQRRDKAMVDKIAACLILERYREEV
ncbi:Holliday junction resolvase RuvX [Chitinispirillales bacterium ANBcel5]|uniref:Holliday junction resolvase RuvX n=1 Tax=Cellulosispirillum alkaliphilum TaxID=3039283 RepID=UPI002A5258BC|nr:Holliday junction resolvase RuvX [Chitinispirillales bacterium ANBcel5]